MYADQVHQQERNPEADGLGFEQWLEHASSAFLPLRAYLPDRTCESAFSGTVAAQRVNVVHVVTVGGGPVEVRRSDREIKRSDPGFLKLGFQLAGHCMLKQRSVALTLGPGDFALYDSSTPYSLSFNGPFQMMVAMIPRTSLYINPRQIDEASLKCLCGPEGTFPMLAVTLMSQMNSMLTKGQLPDDNRISEALLQLVSGALEERVGTLRGEKYRNETLHSVSKAFIENRLHDLDLTPATVAAAQHVSIRTLQAAYQREGYTVSRWIKVRRLEKCHRELIDPRLATKSISDISSKNGFISASHFSNAFKELYGVTPRHHRSLCGAYSIDYPHRDEGRALR